MKVICYNVYLLDATQLKIQNCFSGILFSRRTCNVTFCNFMSCGCSIYIYKLVDLCLHLFLYLEPVALVMCLMFQYPIYFERKGKWRGKCYYCHVILLLVSSKIFKFWQIYPICRTQERQPLQSGSCPWQRLKGIWKMFLPTSKQFPFAGFVVELVALLKQKTVIQMGKDAGLLNQLSLSLICWKMLRVMQRYVKFLLKLHVRLLTNVSISILQTISLNYHAG